MKYKIKNKPIKIYLHPLGEFLEYGDNEEDVYKNIIGDKIISYKDIEEFTTFTTKSVSKFEIPYIRKDLFDNLLKSFRKLQKEYNELKEFESNLYH